MSGGNEIPRSLRARSSDAAVALRNLVRRVVLRTTTRATGFIAQLTGYKNPDGTDEVFSKVEVFGQRGFYSIPPNQGADSTAEAIVLHVGGSDDHPVVVATRDTAMEPGNLDPGDTIMNNFQAEVRINQAGQIALGAKALVNNPLAGVATGQSVDSWGVPLENVSVTVFAK